MEGATIREILHKTVESFIRNQVMDAALDAEWLMSHVLGMDRMQIKMNPAREMSTAEIDRFLQLAERRLQGEPLQYILGDQEFMGLTFKVNPRVLIPRQDTETLVEAAIHILQRKWNGIANVLDVGTGSGAIAISMAHFVPGCSVTAVDIDEGALQIAVQNARLHGLQSRISFQKSNLFYDLPDHDRSKYHMILSNPPYIPSGDISSLQREVKEYEPHLALDGGMDGLAFYRKIADGAAWFLRSGGMLLLEVGYNQAEEVKKILQTGYTDIDSMMDLTGTERVVVATTKKTDRTIEQRC